MSAINLPPADLQAEQRLLAALLANNLAMRRVGALAPEHFADPIHGKIFEAIRRRIAAGELADAVTLRDELADDLVEVGGAAYLAQLLQFAGEIADVAAIGAAIRGTWMARQIIDDAEVVMCAVVDARNAAFAGASVNVAALADVIEDAAGRLRGLLVTAGAA